LSTSRALPLPSGGKEGKKKSLPCGRKELLQLTKGENVEGERRSCRKSYLRYPALGRRKKKGEAKEERGGAIPRKPPRNLLRGKGGRGVGVGGGFIWGGGFGGGGWGDNLLTHDSFTTYRKKKKESKGRGEGALLYCSASQLLLSGEEENCIRKRDNYAAPIGSAAENRPVQKERALPPDKKRMTFWPKQKKKGGRGRGTGRHRGRRRSPKKRTGSSPRPERGKNAGKGTKEEGRVHRFPPQGGDWPTRFFLERGGKGKKEKITKGKESREKKRKKTPRPPTSDPAELVVHPKK